MNIREKTEEIEALILSPCATLASKSKGRLRDEEPCPLRTIFQRDRDRIIHCKSFRRLKYKTQVFLAPEGDHYRTRLTHTLEVAQIARTIARALRLNEDLTEAIALGHDLGHTPFGHAGEKALDEITPGGFKHYEQSLRVVDILENEGKGLNLSEEVRDGIVRHTNGDQPTTFEGKVVRLSDRIGYINHDIDDAVRAGVLSIDDLPSDIIEVLGHTHSERINCLITDLVMNSIESDELKMSDKVQSAFDKLHEFMFASVYFNKIAKSEEGKAGRLVKQLYEYFCNHPEALHEEFAGILEKDGVKKAACDYIAGMTDRYAIQLYTELFVPTAWKN
jgi:dGTPase